MRDTTAESLELGGLLLATAAVFVWSGIAPADRATWVLEAAPVALALPLLIATRKRYPLTPLAYRLIFVHALILLVGAHYTYAEVPLGFWLQELLELSRNHYDRLGHVAQGFIPAIIAREVFVRSTPLRPGGWLFFIVCCFCLGFSAFYELLEWWAALIGGQAADKFLATQGDVWDTQWDMLLALLGSIAAQVLLTRTHDRMLASMRRSRPA